MANANRMPKWINNKLKTTQRLLEQESKAILIEIAEETVGKMKDYIMREWYDTYEPSSYQRTYQLVDAVRYTIRGNTINIYFDRRLIRASKADEDEYWNHHMGFDGIDFTIGLIEYVNDGGNGGLSPRGNQPGIDVIGYAEQEINRLINQKAVKRINAIIKQTLS